MEEQPETLLLVPSVRIYEIKPERKGLLASGDLWFLHFPQLDLSCLRLGDYKCTLYKQLPVAKGESGIYLITDFEGFIGLVLPKDTDPEVLETLETLLLEHTQYTSSIPAEPEPGPSSSYAVRFGSWLVETSESLSSSMINGSKRAGDSLQRGGEVVKTKMTRCEEEQKVHPYFHSGAKGLKSSTEFLLKCSKTVADNAGKASGYVGKTVSNGVSRLSGRGQEPPKEPSSPSNAKVLASDTLKAVKTIVSAAEESIQILAKSAHDTTVGLVEHRYGPQMSGVVSQGLGSLGDLGRVTLTLDQMTVTNLATQVVSGAFEEEKQTEEAKVEEAGMR